MATMNQIRTTGKDGGVRIECRVTENVTRTVQAVQSQFDQRVAIALQEYGRNIKKSVKGSYKDATVKYSAGLSQTTRKIKGHSRALYDSGGLKEMVSDVNDGIHVKKTGDRVSVSISWEIPQSGDTGVAPFYRRNKTFPYLYVHEGGNEISQGNLQSFTMKRLVKPMGRRWKVVPIRWKSTPRPFFFPGIIKGKERGIPELTRAMAPVCDPNIMEAELGPMTLLSYEPFGERLTPTLAPHTVLGMSLFFAPPSRMYAVVGAASDLGGALRGSFTEKTIFGYMRQMAWGSVGITGKTARRRFRRRIWNR